MTQDIDDRAVARYLRDNPAFFQNHLELLTEMLLPDPHKGSAVSLVERQSLVLRERVKSLELRLAELLRIGRDNDALSRSLDEWTRSLLTQADRRELADLAAGEIRRIFDVPLALVRRWSDPPGAGDAVLARWVRAMNGPSCGAQIDPSAIAGMDPGWAGARSVALIPLRAAEGKDAFGLLALGSPDPERFDAALGTAVLARIGELAGAALAPHPV